jgi:precorrin-2 dehydrogenase/sirohydrochlorin ferrochelatase
MMNDAIGRSGRYYPLFLAIEGQICLVVGAGAVGERKVRTLLKYGAQVRLVAPELSPWLKEKCGEEAVTWAGRQYEKSHLQGASLAFATTDDPEVNRTVAADAREMGVWCNMASDPELGSFIVPSAFERGPLSIAISTTGFSPAIAKQLRLKLEKEIGPEWEFFIRLLGELRQSFKSNGLAEKEGEQIFRRLAALPIPEWLKLGRTQKALEKTIESCGSTIPEPEIKGIWEDLWNHFSW